MTSNTSSGRASVAKSKSFGLSPVKKSLTAPPTTYNFFPFDLKSNCKSLTDCGIISHISELCDSKNCWYFFIFIIYSKIESGFTVL